MHRFCCSKKRYILRVAVIDFGTNSILLIIAEKTERGFDIIYQDKEEPRLGYRFERTGRLDSDNMKKSLRALQRLLGEVQKFNVDKTVGIGTRIFRDADNTDEILNLVNDECDFKIAILSEEQEAEYAFKGALWGLNLPELDCIVVDIGGGSTEISYIDTNLNMILRSLSLGAVYLTDRFLRDLPPKDADVANIRNYINNQLSSTVPDDTNSKENVVFSGGTATTTAAAILGLDKYSSEKVHGSRFSRNDLNSFINRIKQSDLEACKRVLNIDPERADIILAGLLILSAILECFGFDRFFVSDGGVRYGVVKEILKTD
ncbi:MAG: hypothetical protein GF315_05040 [candidate division Zixibacteria bacterium]|nr:hypothetical protein [candidate division Zixibacteria bacterium]